jgi:excisionase family DNA binding protein
MTERLLTARELADYLGLSTDTVLDRFERGDLPGFRLFGKKGGPVRFRLSEIEATLATWRVSGPGRGGEVAHNASQRPDPGLVSVLRTTSDEGGEDA